MGKNWWKALSVKQRKRALPTEHCCFQLRLASLVISVAFVVKFCFFHYITFFLNFLIVMERLSL